MRNSLGVLIVSLAAIPAIAGSTYSDCVSSADPAACIARRAVQSGLDANQALDAVVRHGLVDLVPARADDLLQGLIDEIGVHEEGVNSLTDKVLLQTPAESLLAAMALATAARHEPDPFANPVYRKLARQAKGDPRIPALALGLWTEVIGFSGALPDQDVVHVGLPAIWERAQARKEQDTALLQDIAATLTYSKQLLPQMREFYLWLVRLPKLTPELRVGAASSLGRFLDMPELAEPLLDGIVDDVGGYDIRRVRASVAAVHLQKGYDAGSARLVKDVALESLERDGVKLSTFGYTFENDRDALERGNAREELRELGAVSLRHAESAGGKSEAMDWYAASSDFYLRAGDRERAREIARQGLPLVQVFLLNALNPPPGGDSVYRGDWSPKSMAAATQGAGTSPVIALYRTGAIDEALKTGYLVGKDRYLHADRAGEKKDPLWALDATSLDAGVMAEEAARSTDRAFQQRAYGALVRSCRTPLATCFSDTLGQIAEVAAGMGDRQNMEAALAAATRQLDTKRERADGASYVAGFWAHCEEILRAAAPRNSP